MARRADFGSEPGLAGRLFPLLDRVFPGLAASAERIRALGASWEEVSTPFVAEVDGEPVSHVGLIALPLVLMGAEATAGSVHAVATHPEHRGRGHYRAAMEELLAWAESRFPTLVLTTEHPEYFTPFGFRHAPEQATLWSVPEGLRRATPGRLRRLDLAVPADLALLHRLLDEREPVSRVLGVRREKTIFLFNEARNPLWYAPELDAALCLEREGHRLRLYDLVAPRLPRLEDLAACLPWEVEELEICLAPDRLAPDEASHPVLFEHDGPSWLMVRGPFAAEGQPFILPRGART
jgi:predicted N-acetyltransferase YhbS